MYHVQVRTDYHPNQGIDTNQRRYDRSIISYNQEKAGREENNPHSVVDELRSRSFLWFSDALPNHRELKNDHGVGDLHDSH